VRRGRQGSEDRVAERGAARSRQSGRQCSQGETGEPARTPSWRVGIGRSVIATPWLAFAMFAGRALVLARRVRQCPFAAPSGDLRTRNRGVVPAAARRRADHQSDSASSARQQQPALCELRTCARPHGHGRQERRRADLCTAGPKAELLFASTALVPRMCTGITGTLQRLARYEAPPLNSRPNRRCCGHLGKDDEAPAVVDELRREVRRSRLSFERSIGIAPRPKDQKAAFQ